MKKIILFVSIFLAACSAQPPQATVTATATLPPPTATVIPTPTLTPAFLAMQEQVAGDTQNYSIMGSGNLEGKLPDGTIGVINGIKLNPDGTSYTIMVNGAPVVIGADKVSITDEGGVRVDGYDDSDGDGNFEKVVAIDATTWAGMGQIEKDAVLENFPATSPDGYTRDGYGTANDTLVKYLAEDGSVGSVFDVTTGKFLTPGEAGEIDYPTISFVNGKGETISIPEFGKDQFDKNIQYIADNAVWNNGNRNDTVSIFARSNPALDEILAKFEGISGMKIVEYSMKALPLKFDGPDDYFCLYIGSLGKGTLMIFENKAGYHEAVYSEISIREIQDKRFADPVMTTLHP